MRRVWRALRPRPPQTEVVADPMPPVPEADGSETGAAEYGPFASFDSLIVLGRADWRAVMGRIERHCAAMALKGAGDEMRERVFGSLLPWRTRRLREEMTALPPVPLRDVVDSMSAILAVANDLVREGKISHKPEKAR